MKVCIATGAYTPYSKGGGEVSAQQLAEGLAERGVDVVVLTIGPDEINERINGIRVIRFTSFNIYWGTVESENKGLLKKAAWHLLESYNFRIKLKLDDFFKNENPDILHVRNITDMSPYLWKVASKRGVKVISTLNNYACICVKTSMFRNHKNCHSLCLPCKITSFPKRYLSNFVDGVISVSLFTLEKHKQLGFFKNAICKVIYTGLPSKFQELPVIQSNFLSLGWIGRIDETKGVYELIQAFSSLNSDSVLYIAGIGEPEYVEKCKAIASSKVVFLDYIKSEEFYKLVDIVIINSLWNEPFPRVLIESYSNGRPVLTTNRGGTREMVKTNETGFVFDPDKDSLQDELSKLEQLDLSDLKSMRKNIAKFITGLSAEMIEQHIKFYHEILDA